MIGYRCYVLDAEDHILQAHDLDCDNDAHATTVAEKLLGQDPYYRFAEVWKATRRIAKLERRIAMRLHLSHGKPFDSAA
jgi:hypothetical protein